MKLKIIMYTQVLIFVTQIMKKKIKSSKEDGSWKYEMSAYYEVS